MGIPVDADEHLVVTCGRERVQHLIRFHFAKREATLREAARRLAGLRRHATSATKWPLAP